MKRNKVISAIFSLMLILCIVMSGCGKDTAFGKEEGQADNTTSISESTDDTNDQTDESDPSSGDTIVFKDDLGREVSLPKDIKTYVPSGSLSQIVCFAICPDKMASVAGSFSDDANDLIDPKYLSLPETGSMIGGKGDFSKEALMEIGPDVVIDVGDSKKTEAEEFDKFTEDTGLKIIHIYIDFDDYKTGMQKIGELLGCEDSADEVVEYIDSAMEDVSNVLSKRSDDKKGLLYCMGSEATNVLARDTYQSIVIDRIGDNLAVVENPVSKGSGNEVDLEQIINWNPDFILFGSDVDKEAVLDNPSWQSLDAISNGNYAFTPDLVYNWMGMPPSLQRYLGALWLTDKMYPDMTDYDIKEKTQEFYRIFLHTELSDERCNALLGEYI